MSDDSKVAKDGSPTEDDLKARQMQMLECLQAIEPNRPIEVMHFFGDPWHLWTECTHYKPFLARTVLANELVFDFDSPDWTELVGEAWKLVEHLGRTNVPYYLAFTGGKGLHVHVFPDPASVAIAEGLGRSLERYGIDVMCQVREFLADRLLAEAGVDRQRAKVDWAKIRWSKFTRGSMIRMCGARRTDGACKTLIDGVPPERPSSLPLQFPKVIMMWDIHHLQEDIVRLLGQQTSRAEESAFRPVAKGSLNDYPCYARLMEGLEVGKRELGAFNIALWNKAKGVPESQAAAEMAIYSQHCQDADEALLRENLATLKGTYSRSYHGISCEAIKANLGPEFCNIEHCPKYQKAEKVVHRLMRIVTDARAEPFLDERGEPYVTYEVGGHRENHRLESGEFRNWLIAEYWNRHRDAPHDEAIKAAVAMLSARAVAQGKKVELSIRVARQGDDVYIDLGDETWAALRVSPGRWEVVDHPPVLFRRTAGMLPLPRPTRGGKVSAFLQLTRLSDRDRILLPVLLVSYLVPGFPHPIAQFVGPPGSLKSTTAEFMKALADPNVVSRGGMTKSVEEFAQQFDHSYVTVLDNLSYLPKEYSDRTCKASTGEAFLKRKLYSDDGDVIYKYQRCVLVTSLHTVTHSEDFLERSIIFSMEMLPDALRRSEEEVRSEFEAARPAILGAMLDTLAQTMVIKPTLALKNLPRMADFAVWGEAISQAMGYREGEFYHAYRDSLRDRNEEALRGHPVGLAVMYMMDEQDRYVGTMTELLGRLNDIASRYGIDTTERWWPRAGNWLSARLEAMRQNLYRQGIVYWVAPGWRVKDEYKLATGRTLEPRNVSVVIIEHREPKEASWFDPPPPEEGVRPSQGIQDNSSAPKEDASPSSPAAQSDVAPERPFAATPDPPSGRSAEQTVAEIKRNLAAALGADWKSVELEVVGEHLKHIFDGNSDDALRFFKHACEQRWLPYQVTVDGRVLR